MGASIEEDFSESPIALFPSKYLLSIFYNLIGNALKYKFPERVPIIRLKSQKGEQNSIILSIQDNGLGIDLEKHKNNIFKIGKRTELLSAD